MPIAIALLAAALAGAVGTGARPAPAATGHDRRTDSTAAVYVPPPPLHAKEFALIHENGLFHLFYMRLNAGFPDDSSLNSLGHAISGNLVDWTELDTVLAARPGAWDSDHIWSPSMIKRGGTWYMYYTGVKNVPFGWSWFQRIGVATSTDLINWTRYDAPVFTGAMVPWAVSDSSTFDGCQFRDAFVMADPADTTHWLMYYVTTPAAVRGQLIAAVARNDGGLTPWSDLTPLWCTDEAHFWGWCESPVLMQHGSLWFMFATTNSGHPIRYRTAPGPTADSTLWSGTYRLFDNAGQDPVSDQWFGPEVLSANGHDYIAYVDGGNGTIGIKEMVWGPTAPDFTLANPQVLDVPPAPGAGGLRLAVLGRPGAGGRVLFRITNPGAADGRLEILDVTGRRVSTVRRGPLPAGDTYAEWDGRVNGAGRTERGIYFARLVTPVGSRVARLAVLE
jgi:hypothetical protein